MPLDEGETVTKSKKTPVARARAAARYEQAIDIAVLGGVPPHARETLCHSCGQLRIWLRPETPRHCGNCCSLRIVVGDVDGTELAAQKAEWSAARAERFVAAEPWRKRAEQEQLERARPGEVRPFVRELAERGRVNDAEWDVPMNSYERDLLQPALLDEVFIAHARHCLANCSRDDSPTYDVAAKRHLEDACRRLELRMIEQDRLALQQAAPREAGDG